MKPSSGNPANKHLHKYNVMIIILIAFAIIVITGVWMFYNQKNARLERDIYMIQN